MAPALLETLYVGPLWGSPQKGELCRISGTKGAGGAAWGSWSWAFMSQGRPLPTRLGVSPRRRCLGTCRQFEATCASGTGLALPAASVSVSPPGLRGLDVPRWSGDKSERSKPGAGGRGRFCKKQHFLLPPVPGAGLGAIPASLAQEIFRGVSGFWPRTRALISHTCWPGDHPPRAPSVLAWRNPPATAKLSVPPNLVTICPSPKWDAVLPAPGFSQGNV